MLGESMLTALGTSIAFLVFGTAIMSAFGFSIAESLTVGLALTFSSTILGLKLLPVTALHHRHIGEIVISLLIQTCWPLSPLFWSASSRRTLEALFGTSAA